MSDLKMPDLNSVVLAGRLTRDPELKYTGANKPFAKFSMANTRRFKLQGGEGYQEETTFVDVTIWGPSAEWIARDVKKGHAVIVEGRINQQEWQDAQSGQTRRKLDIMAQRVNPLEWHKRHEADGGAGSRGASGNGGGIPVGSEGDPYPDEDDLAF